MENLDKNFELEVTVAFTNKLICKKCEVFSRPDVKMVICSSCTKLLCQNCCGTQCPLCQHESQNPKVLTFIQQPELMELYSGFKTHPCVNVKNGCHKSRRSWMLWKLMLKVVFFNWSLVPTWIAKKTSFSRKDLDKHLKQGHSNDIEVYYATLKRMNILSVNGNDEKNDGKKLSVQSKLMIFFLSTILKIDICQLVVCEENKSKTIRQNHFCFQK